MNLSQMPKVSIIIPVYNGANYLKASIDAALSQTYANLEVIVVNDGSNDHGATHEIALTYGDKIRYFQKENGGVSSALNYGIREMTGEYFSWLSHDDLYTPDKVKDSIEALLALGAIDGRTVAYSGGNYIDKDSKIVKVFPVFLQTNKCYSSFEMISQVVKHSTLNGCCMLIPKTVFETCGGFAENLRYSQDSLMWYQMFLHGFGLVYDGKPNVMYRLHTAQTSHTRHELFEKDANYIAQLLAPELLKISSKKQNMLYQYALHMAKYRCVQVVETMQACAAGSECKFTVAQRLNLWSRLIYGGIRGSIKKVYYRSVLKVKV